MNKKNVRFSACVALILSFGSQLLVAQQAPLPVKSVEEIKELERKVVQVVAKAQPATVSLTSDLTGAWGSGVVVSEDGVILSAAHVVQGAETMTVIFPDGTETQAEVLGANYTKDTAMLKITEAGQYPFVLMGDSDGLVVGNFLVAMGHAGGHDPLRKPPVRFGRLVSRNLTGFFSSDCTLIGGDSGGPIFDIDGNLVGVNSSIGWDWKANNHAGISGLKDDWGRLVKGEQWGALGANPFADEDSPLLGILLAGNVRGGVLVGPVAMGSAAYQSGIEEGDVLQAIEGTAVRSVEELVIEVNRYRPGQVIELTVMRGAKTLKTRVTLMRRGDLRR